MLKRTVCCTARANSNIVGLFRPPILSTRRSISRDHMSEPNETIGTWAMLRLLLVMMKFLPQKLVLFYFGVFFFFFSLSRRLRDIV